MGIPRNGFWLQTQLETAVKMMELGSFLSFTFLCDVSLLQEDSYHVKMIISNSRFTSFSQIAIRKEEQPSPSQRLCNKFHGGILTLLALHVCPLDQAL